MRFFKRDTTLHALYGRIEDQMQALWNRNQLIADQDAEITRLRKEVASLQENLETSVTITLELRGENRTLQQDITRLIGERDACARERDYWQGKAANP